MLLIHRRSAVLSVLFTLVFGLVMMVSPHVFFLNTTNSVPLDLYLRVPGHTYSVGDYIVYPPTDDVVSLGLSRGWMTEETKKRLFIKQVGAVSGDQYAVNAVTQEFKINGIYYGHCLTRDGEGREMPIIYGVFDVDEGYILPVSKAYHSFDGRYTGVIKEDSIICKVVPLFVE